MQGAAPQWSKVLHICAQPACTAVAAETVFVFSTRLNSCSAGRETRHWSFHGGTGVRLGWWRRWTLWRRCLQHKSRDTLQREALRRMSPALFTRTSSLRS
jgi:hypothetical protein